LLIFLNNFHLNLGIFYYRHKKYAEANECFSECIELNPISNHLYYLKGMMLFNLSKNSEAVVVFSKSLKLVPQNFNALVYKGKYTN